MRDVGAEPEGAGGPEPMASQPPESVSVEEGRRERDLAAACGYDFVIGVRTEIHKRMLRDAAPELKVVLMTWC